MHNNRNNAKYVMRGDPPPDSICYPFEGNPVKYGGTFKNNMDGVNGYMLCLDPQQT